jgi:hypothetical protein
MKGDAFLYTKVFDSNFTCDLSISKNTTIDLTDIAV